MGALEDLSIRAGTGLPTLFVKPLVGKWTNAIERVSELKLLKLNLVDLVMPPGGMT
jgi:hypothetical protein